MRERNTRRNAFFIADAVIGIAIVAVLSVSLIGLLGRRRQAAQRLADLREATRAAEAVMTDLQAGKPAWAPGARPGSAATVRDLAPSDTPGRTWVEVDVTVGSQRAVLAGLVPVVAATQPSTTEAQ